MRSRLSNGVPTESLDEITNELNLMISHLEFSLIKRPDWAEDLRSFLDISLLQAIYAEVVYAIF